NDNKARFELSVAILDGDTPVAEFEGVFYVLPPSKNEEE
ncbi:MAG: GNAT family N-acetyltransferase, partial [Pseudomonadota bacterium]|nr:GNAT family N-acetyltransferase [Pseudomonadota bacterium]